MCLLWNIANEFEFKICATHLPSRKLAQKFKKITTAKSTFYASVILFLPQPPSLESPGLRGKICVTREWSEKKAGHWKIKGLKWLIRAGQGKKKINRPGQPKKSYVPGGDGGRTIWPAHKLWKKYCIINKVYK